MTARFSIGCPSREGGCGRDWIAPEPAAIGERCSECGHVGVVNWGRLVVEADEATPDVIDAAIDAADFYPPPEKIDWDDLLSRIESVGADGWNFGDDSDSPAIRKIKRAVRASRVEQ